MVLARVRHPSLDAQDTNLLLDTNNRAGRLGYFMRRLNGEVGSVNESPGLRHTRGDEMGEG